MADFFNIEQPKAKWLDTYSDRWDRHEAKRDQWNIERNFQFAQNQFDYMKAENQLTRDREDSAVQRRMQDIMAAGLHPSLALGGTAAQSQTVGVSSPPRSNTSTISSARTDMEIMRNAANLLSQTPQVASAINLERSQANYYKELAESEKWLRGVKQPGDWDRIDAENSRKALKDFNDNFNYAMSRAQDQKQFDAALEQRESEFSRSLTFEEKKHYDIMQNEMKKIKLSTSQLEQDERWRKFQSNLETRYLDIARNSEIRNDQYLLIENKKFVIEQAMNEAKLTQMAHDMKIEDMNAFMNMVRSYGQVFTGILDTSYNMSNPIRRSESTNRNTNTSTTYNTSTIYRGK